MATLEFPRGNEVEHTFTIPAASWSAGGVLVFAAKPVIDDDLTDAAAVIKAAWDDDDVIDVTIKGVAYKRYICTFPPAATNSIVSNGAESADYLADFMWVPLTGGPFTYPPLDPKIDALVIFNVTRDTTP